MKMKADQMFRCLFWAIFYCILYMVNVNSEDELMDFDFSDLKEIDWNYENDNSNDTMASVMSSSTSSGNHPNLMDFNTENYDYVDNRVHPFDWREKILRNALSKALTNKAQRQKFVEVMPILRVLSRQQRLALSAIISAKVNAKKGQELKLDQVRMMFGDDKKLLIPIVYDIANLVGNSAKKYLHLNYPVLSASAQQQRQTSSAPQMPQIERRKLDLIESDEIDDSIGVIPSGAADDSSLQDFFDEISDDVLDAKSINEELQADVENSTLKFTKPVPKRSKRDATKSSQSQSTDFIHKLIRSIPPSVNEGDLALDSSARTIKLNTTSFVVPNKTEDPTSPSISDKINTEQVFTQMPSYEEVEDLAFASLNGTEINLNNDDGIEFEEKNTTESEPLPSPEELISGPRYRTNGNKMRLIRRKIPPAIAKKKRVHISRIQQRFKGPHGPHASGSSTAIGTAAVLAPRKCERFTASMCIRTEDYPLDEIMGSIRRHKNAMSALLAEHHDKPLNLDFSEEFNEFSYNQRRREDEASTGNGGSMCQSIVRYARPQKARSASGEWKYIVNTGQHTQTLRLEKCSKPQESCSYLAHNYRSHCAQIYNYHRLLSWDKTRGLHVDIFKVPTCCSCQIDGYRQQFPPLDSIKAKEFSSAYNPENYSTINEELDYNDDEDDEDLSLQYSNKYNHHKRGGGSSSISSSSSSNVYDANELLLSTKKTRTNIYAPNPTVGAYLSPPGSNEYDINYAYKSGQHSHHTHQPHHRSSSTASGFKNAYSQLERRRPYKSLSHGFETESRADLEISPSETHMDKEVNIFGTTNANDNTRQVQQKRKRIYSMPHTATTGISSSSGPTLSTASVNSTYIPTQGHGYRSRNGNGNAKGKGFNTEHSHGPFGSSSATTITHQTTATSPSYYTAESEEHIIGPQNTNTKFRYTPTRTSQSLVPSFSTTLSSTESTAYRQSVAAAAAAAAAAASSSASYPPLYHIGFIFNMSNGHATNAAGSKRINYNYHPIIDFFENNNSKRYHSPSLSSPPSSPSSAPSSSSSISSKALPTFSTVSSYEEQPTHATPSSQDQLYPYKIRKYSSVSRNKYPVQTQQPSDGKRERRIEIGPGDGNFNGKSNDLTVSTNNQDNVWHPVLA